MADKKISTYTPHKKQYYETRKKDILTKARAYYVKTKYISRDKRYESIRIANHKLKNIVFSHYGWECACCGENNPLFLTIDHINNDGYLDKLYCGKRRTGTNLQRKIIKENFPNTYQILCWNCNCGKRSNNGVCPHLNEEN